LQTVLDPCRRTRTWYLPLRLIIDAIGQIHSLVGAGLEHQSYRR